MLRKNPELRPTAVELLNHPHLQPYILQIHLKLNSPPRSTFPFQWPETNSLRRTQFVEEESDSTLSGLDKCSLLSNDRALNPSISGNEQGSQCSTQRVNGLAIFTKEKVYELPVGCVHDERNTNKSIAIKSLTVDKTPRLRTDTDYATPRKLTKAKSKTSRTSLKRDSLPVSHKPTRKFSPSKSQVGLPTTTYRSNVGLFQNVKSPNVSVNPPGIDKIQELPLASCEDPFLSFFTIQEPSLTSAKCSSSSTKSADSSITKDKCTIQKRVVVHSSGNGGCPKVSECWELHQSPFDTSSYQQRAEALEGLLEFSARLLKHRRFEELGVLLKPFGAEKVSSRETAIWLTKSFRETVL
ncbi:putative non-specific serine/threonine protein kinase [Lupinus albus]|uniref:Putative non-specific serine/threonine protein kinase n=1 Tax=Lupinus albus TaxID=3870 RepID=A0A6A4R501_LUPAL|nr:putative non-specific serine/threonine protein kinase [Lupinus albus]